MAEIPNLANFLRELADSLEQNKLHPEQVQKIGEFYMFYKFMDTIDTEPNGEISNKEFMKFITLGWYVYKMILN